MSLSISSSFQFGIISSFVHLIESCPPIFHLFLTLLLLIVFSYFSPPPPPFLLPPLFFVPSLSPSFYFFPFPFLLSHFFSLISSLSFLLSHFFSLIFSLSFLLSHFLLFLLTSSHLICFDSRLRLELSLQPSGATLIIVPLVLLEHW